ncbi:MAG: nitrite/sulfite reductase, partial [Cucumibacter sp.]
AYFAPPAFKADGGTRIDAAKTRIVDPAYGRFLERNTNPHFRDGYLSVTVSLKPIGGTPGDATSEQMDAIADLAEEFSFDELRVSHEQNLVFPHVAISDLRAVYEGLVDIGLAEANAGLISDIIACPGLDFCALATARSIPIAQAISQKFSSPERQKEIGDLKIKISGCINACGHHHVGHIGILGLEKRGVENYQITVGGDATEDAAIGTILGPGVPAEDVPDAIEKLVDTYIANRTSPQETFIVAFRRLGETPFKEALYGAA